MLHQLAGVDRQIGLPPHADRQFAKGPAIGQLDAADRHRFCVTLGCRRRDDADPDIAFDEPADRVEAAQLHAQLEAAADRFGLFRQKPLQGAGPVEADEIAVERLGEGDPFQRRQLVRRSDDEHEPVGAERQGFEAGHLDRAGDDADIGGAVGDGPDDLVAEPLLEIDADLRVCRQKGAQWLGQEFGQGVGIGQQPHLAAHALGILVEIAAHALGLLQHQAGVLDQGAAGLGRLYAEALAVQQGDAERRLHVADAGAGRGDRQMHAFGAMGDAAGLDDMQKQSQVDKIKAHWSNRLSPVTKAACADCRLCQGRRQPSVWLSRRPSRWLRGNTTCNVLVMDFGVWATFVEQLVLAPVVMGLARAPEPTIPLVARAQDRERAVAVIIIKRPTAVAVHLSDHHQAAGASAIPGVFE